jgi:hypothetical protein
VGVVSAFSRTHAGTVAVIGVQLVYAEGRPAGSEDRRADSNRDSNTTAYLAHASYDDIEDRGARAYRTVPLAELIKRLPSFAVVR